MTAEPCPRPACDGTLARVDALEGPGDRDWICTTCGELVSWRRLDPQAPMPSERDPDWRPPWWMVGGRPDDDR